MTKSEVKRIFGHLEELAGEWPLGIARIKQLASKPTMSEVANARKQILDKGVKNEDLNPIAYYARTEYSWEIGRTPETKINCLIEKILVEAYRREKSEPGSISAIKNRVKIATLEKNFWLENKRRESDASLPSAFMKSIENKKPATGVAIRALEILEKINKNREATNVK